MSLNSSNKRFKRRKFKEEMDTIQKLYLKNDESTIIINSTHSSIYPNNISETIVSNKTLPSTSNSIQHNTESNIPINNTSSNLSTFDPLSDHIIEPNLSNEIPLTPKVNLRNKDFKNDLSNWAIDCNVPQTTVNKLLQIMKCYEVIKTEDLPLDSRTLLAPPKSTNIIKRIVIPGHYHHFGLANGIKHYASTKLNEIIISIGIDGLPLSKSSNSQFWPILAYIVNDIKTVFPVGVYHGYTKPKNSDEFLLDFIEEAKCLMTNGIILNNRTLKVTIHSFIADSPAKAFLLNTKGHSGYYSCYRCIEEGEYCGSNVCFPYSIYKAARRTHEDYVEMKYEDHHIGNASKLIELPGIDLVRMVPLDYMHLVCIGVMKKLIILWLNKGPVITRLPSQSVKKVTESLLSLTPFIPSDFVRKTRAIQDVGRWKATELRLFLLYVGPVVLEDVLNHDLLSNFMSLNIAMLILLSPDYACYLNYAEELLDYFVKTFEQIYGRKNISHNVHGMLHIADDYKMYGPLDNCSAFPYENFMKILKSKIRKSEKPLEQLVNRYKELYNQTNKNLQNDRDQQIQLLKSHTKGPLVDNITGPQYYKLVYNKIKINVKLKQDSYILTTSGEIVMCLNIVQTQNNKIMIIGKSFNRKLALFEKPVNSTIFNIYKIYDLNHHLKCWEDNKIQKKIMVLHHNGNLIAMPLIHS